MAIDISINKELGDKAQEFIDAYLATGHGCSDKPAEVILKNRRVKERILITIQVLDD